MRTYGSLRLTQKGKWLIEHLAPHVAIRLKHLFPRIAKTETVKFEFPNDMAHCADLDWFISRYPLLMSTADSRALTKGRKSFEKQQAHLEEILRPEYTPSAAYGLKPGQVLRQYQGQAIDLVLQTKALLLGDDVGLGKTYTSAGLVLHLACRPAAIVVDPHLQEQWREKLEGFTNLTVHCIKGTRPYNLPAADVYIFRYSQLAGWVDVFSLGLFKTVIYDEIQSLRKGLESEKGKAAAVLSANCEYRLGLSATPIYNYGVEVFNILEILAPGVLGNREEFLREWTNNDQQVKDPVALGSYLREQRIFLRRTKQDVGQELPRVNTMVEEINHDTAALKSVEDLARKLAMRYETGSFEEKGQAARELDLLVRQATGISKARAVAQYARLFLEADIPVLLTGWHRAVYDIWLRDLAEFNPVMYTGSESDKQKRESKEAFLSGKTNLFIMSLRSGAGLDGLQYRCSTLLHGELDWSPKVHEQIVGRLDREGQKEIITSVYLTSNDGSDPPMVELLGVKASQAAGIIDPGRVFEANYSDSRKVQLLVNRYLQTKKVA